MLKPTQDKEAIKILNEFMAWAWQQGHGFDSANHEPQHEIDKVAEMTNELATKLGELGYHKGLPPNIVGLLTECISELNIHATKWDLGMKKLITETEEALNSKDTFGVPIVKEEKGK